MVAIRIPLAGAARRLPAVAIGCLAFLVVSCCTGTAQASGNFNLWYVDHTGIEIALAWDSVPGATGYSVERDTASTFNTARHVVYTLDASATGFGDTGWPANDLRRFQTPSNPTDSPVYHLDAGTGYYYRVGATTPGGTLLSTVIGPYQVASYQSPAQIVRGTPGDLWADAVLGRPGFGENSWWKTDPYHIQSPGGVLVDRNTSHPTHVFLVDSNHNRILGMASLGQCSISQAPCSIDADCNGATCRLTPGEIAPQVVLGQPSATDAGACNGDGTAQIYPHREIPTASTLCFVRPDQISVGETAISIQSAVDTDHNLYVPDQWNHRVLMYRDPFNPANGTAAVAVWGQASVTTGSGMLGAEVCPAGSSMGDLCLPNAVDIDAAGDLWVSDFGHNRVLRFARSALSGTIAATADIALAPGAAPNSVRVDPVGNVYVSTSAHLLRFATPQIGGSNSSQVLSFIESDPNFSSLNQLSFDPTGTNYLWAQIRWDTAVRINLTTQQVTERVHGGLSLGLDVSQAGDVFWTESADYIAGLYRLGAAEVPGADGRGTIAFFGFGVPTPDSMISALSITTAGNQLLISDRYTVYFWNDYHSITQSAGTTHPPDGTWGLSPITSGGDAYLVTSDTSGRIWINSRFTGLKLFQAPLTSTAVPIKTFSPPMYYKNTNGAVVPWPAGTSFDVLSHFLPVGPGDRVWVEDYGHSRVMRVVNFDGYEDPSSPPYVDIVLGQASFQGTSCNRGNGYFGFDRDTLCEEDVPSIDPQGNFYIQDNATGGMDGGWARLLRWNAGTIPDNPSHTLFGILPDRVYGAGGETMFTVPPQAGNPFYPYPDNDPAFPPMALACDPQGRMFVGGANPYAGARFPMVYLNKEQNALPQLALGDTMSLPSVSYVDPDGNLYLGDYDWQRVLVYKQPLARFTPPNTPPPTPTPTGTPPTPTSTRTHPLTPTVTPTARDYRGILLNDGAGPYYRLDEASGTTAFDSSGLGLNATYVSFGQLQYGQLALPPFQNDPAVLVSGAGVQLPATASPVTETIEGWFRPTGAVDAKALIVRVDSTGSWQRMLWISAGWPAVNKFTYSFAIGGTQYNVVGTTTVVPNSTYYVVVTLNMTGNASSVRLYVNGVQEAALTAPGTPLNADHWQIGLQGGGGLGNFVGVMDEAAFYNTILSPAQVSNHYVIAEAIAAPTSSPAAPTPNLTPTPTSTPTPVMACAVAPRTGCEPPQRSAGISLNTASRATVRWNWLGGSTPIALTQFGNPVSGSSSYHLCVYDTSAGPPFLVFGATVPAGGTCGTRPCWKQIRNRFSYTNAAATPDGVKRMTLQATAGRTAASIHVTGGGSNLHMPVSADGVFLLREFPEVIVQLQRNDSPDCWEAVFTSPPARDTRWAFADTIH